MLYAAIFIEILRKKLLFIPEMWIHVLINIYLMCSKSNESRCYKLFAVS